MSAESNSAADSRNPFRHPSKWGKQGKRIDASLKVDDAHWIQTPNGWRYATDQVSEDEWVARRRHARTWHQGAARGGAQVMREPTPRNKPERAAHSIPRNFFSGPAGARVHGGMPLVKPARELKSWARPVLVRGQRATDTGIRKAELKNTFALVTWPDHRQDWVNIRNLRDAPADKRFGLVA